MCSMLILTDNKKFKKKKCSVISSLVRFGINLYVDSTTVLEEQLSNKKMISDAMDEYLGNGSYFFKKIRRNDIGGIFENVEYVVLDLKYTDIKEFIENNPFIKSKKIVLSGKITICDYDNVKKLIQYFDGYHGDIYVEMEYNHTYVKLDDCFNTISKIKEQADRILSLNLSPMETIMYVYDLVRKREYKNEKVDESCYNSRDLNRVIEGDKIVCVGYSNIFSALLNYMGIRCFNVVLRSKDNCSKSHQRNVVYVKDKKYDIDGVYYFDATWDSKRETDDYLKKYKFFAKTRNEMVQYENDVYSYSKMKKYSDAMALDMEELFNEDSFYARFYVYDEYKEMLEYMSEIIDGNQSLDFWGLNSLSDEEIITKAKYFLERFNKPLPAETFIKLLNNVRKIEYYQDSDLYQYTFEELYKIYKASDFEFSMHYYNYEKDSIGMIIDEKYDVKNTVSDEDFNTFLRREGIEKDINSVRLTKVLSRYNKKRYL